LYDTNTVAATPTLTTEQRYFSVPEGQGGKTATETNMQVNFGPLQG
jgi:hypothetical protein